MWIFKIELLVVLTHKKSLIACLAADEMFISDRNWQFDFFEFDRGGLGIKSKGFKRERYSLDSSPTFDFKNCLRDETKGNFLRDRNLIANSFCVDINTIQSKEMVKIK